MARIALVHDYLLVMRGAERTFAALTDVWPDAPIYTLLYDERGTGGRFHGRTVITSPVQRLGARQHNFRFLLPVLGPAARAMSVDGVDGVVSSSSAYAHMVRVPPGTPHICFCHTPFRYAWEAEALTSTVPDRLRPAVRVLMRRHRAADRRAAARVDQFVATSEYTRERIKSYWGRDSIVIHPPVDVDRFTLGEPEDYVLFVGELVGHKRAEDAIEAAITAGRRIKVVGGGPELPRLRARFRGAEFLGRVNDAKLTELYERAAALVIPNVEEFGIAAVESQAAGRPVVAIDAGGVRETVSPGRTGILVPPGDPRALASALASDLTQFDSQAIQAHAQRFSRQMFETRMSELVASYLGPRSETLGGRTAAAPSGSYSSQERSLGIGSSASRS
jgi:glycosyltransferase involved in cell wall biosynthesis